jgi:hypothetical protein
MAFRRSPVRSRSGPPKRRNKDGRFRHPRKRPLPFRTGHFRLFIPTRATERGPACRRPPRGSWNDRHVAFRMRPSCRKGVRHATSPRSPSSPPLCVRHDAGGLFRCEARSGYPSRLRRQLREDGATPDGGGARTKFGRVRLRSAGGQAGSGSWQRGSLRRPCRGGRRSHRRGAGLPATSDAGTAAGSSDPGSTVASTPFPLAQAMLEKVLPAGIGYPTDFLASGGIAR